MGSTKVTGSIESVDTVDSVLSNRRGNHHSPLKQGSIFAPENHNRSVDVCLQQDSTTRAMRIEEDKGYDPLLTDR